MFSSTHANQYTHSLKGGSHATPGTSLDSPTVGGGGGGDIFALQPHAVQPVECACTHVRAFVVTAEHVCLLIFT